MSLFSQQSTYSVHDGIDRSSATAQAHGDDALSFHPIVPTERNQVDNASRKYVPYSVAARGA